MNESIRKHFGLTQERMADWLGIDRSTLAHVESGRRAMPLEKFWQEVRLDSARRGQVPDATGHTQLGPPPLPVPAPALEPLADRLYVCRHHIRQMHYNLNRMRKRAAPFEARLQALPALRAWAGPVAHPDFEESWLKLFESEAISALRDDCGPGPQRLLEARIAGLEREAELLEQALDELSAAVPAL